MDNLCTSAMWLDSGRIVRQGAVGETISTYLKSTASVDGAGKLLRRQWPTTGACIRAVRLLDSNVNPCGTLPHGGIPLW